MNIEENRVAAKYERLDMVILAAACFVTLFALGDRSLWGSEGRWAEITREMMLTGDYFHPTINGEPYFDKPLVTYWFIATIAFVTGTLNELTARLPSALAGIAAVWATLRLGRRLASPEVGRIAAVILLTSYGLIYQSRMAAADTENLATVMLAVLWYWSRRDKLNFGTFIVLYLIIFIGSLCKGPVAAVVAAMVILTDAISEKRWKAFLGPASILAGVIGLAVYFAPFIWASKTNPASYTSSGLALVWQENVLRFVAPTDHKNPIYTYILAVPELILPWAPLFIAALIAAIMHWKKLDAGTRWLVKVIAVIFVFFSLSGSRRDYYILPIIPFCALLTAAIFTQFRRFMPSKIVPVGYDIQKGLLFGAIGVELVAAVVFLIMPKGKDLVPLAAVASLSIMLAAAAIVAAMVAFRASARLTERAEERVFIPLGVAALFVMGGFFCVQQPKLESFRSENQFAADIKKAAADIPAERVALLQKGEVDAKMIFYVGKKTPVTLLRYNSKDPDAARLADNAKAVRSFLESSRPGILIAQARYAADLPAECRSLLSQAPDLKETPTPLDSKSSMDKDWEAWLLNSGRTQAASPKTGEKTTDEK
jgi:4-amino-4-deoxy-L-arabinose transferase-like glycosyltransferase